MCIRDRDTVIDFEQLGVDRLFIDESHFYKNLYLYTKMRNVGGICLLYTSELKEKAPMQWVGLMNNIRSQAEEVILTELIYK